MTWFKVDDKLHSHRKAVRAGEAMALWVIAGSWCADHLTDGFVPDYIATRLVPDGCAMAERLVTAGMWEPGEQDGDTGWRFNDWEEYQPTKEEVEDQRGVSRRRWAMNNNPELRSIVRGRDGDDCRYCGDEVNWNDRRGKKGGTYDHVVPMSEGGDESPKNIVVCCRECNGKKGARTPEQAGMKLRPVQDNPGSDLDRGQEPDGSANTSRPDPTRTQPQDPTPPSADADRDEVAEQFNDEFWPIYPPTNGRKPEKGKALTQWRKLTADQRARAIVGARHLAAADTIPKHAFRFLRKDTAGEFPFDDWQTPASPTARASPGAAKPPPRDADYDDGWTGRSATA